MVPLIKIKILYILYDNTYDPSLKIAGYAFDLPVTISYRIGPVTAMQLLRSFRIAINQIAPCRRLIQGPLSGRGEASRRPVPDGVFVGSVVFL